MTEAQADKDLQRETEEFLAAKRRKKEEEKKMEEAKKSLLEKHNEILQQEQGFFTGKSKISKIYQMMNAKSQKSGVKRKTRSCKVSPKQARSQLWQKLQKA